MASILEEMKNIDIRTVDRDTLVDIKDVKVNPNLSKVERMADYINQIKNPYCYKCGKITVKVSFANTEETIADKLESYLLSL